MEAQVYKIHSDFYYVKPKDNKGELLSCKLREVLKKQKVKVKVGDFVEIENNGAIKAVLARKNTLSRPSVSNLDMVVVVSSLLEPPIDFIQLNRYLTFLKYFKIPALLCFNKDDLLDKPALEKIKNEILSIYKPLGYDIIFTSALMFDGLSEFQNLVKGKTIAFCGLSGVGKSSILGSLSYKDIKTGRISSKSKRGTHTTRHCEIVEINDTKIIDTPGFSKLVFDFLLPKDLSELFDDIKKYSKDCKYSDCLHTKEDEGCGVIKNIEKINKNRYESYLNFLNETFEYKQKVTFESQKKENFVKNNFDKKYTKISSKKRADSRKKTKQNTKNLHLDEIEENK